MQIVTTLPSATETVARLGLEPVGVSHECDYPPGVESRPSITRSRVDARGSSAEIDRQVLSVTGTDGDGDTDTGVYDVDAETLEALEPELIVTQGMCDVCAVDEVVVADAVDQISADPEVLTTDPHTVGDVLDDVERIGRAVGRAGRAVDVRRRLEERIDRVRERTAGLEPDERPRVAIFDWTDPVMIAGHWTAELVEWAGGEYGLAGVGDRSQPREWADIREYDPEVVIVGPCGFDLEQVADNRTDLTEREGWADLTAVREGRVWAMDGNHYLNRPGPRLVETLEALARIVQPDRFGDAASEAAGDTLEAGDGAVTVDGDTLKVDGEPIAMPFADLTGRLEAGGQPSV
ncbi:ABC transporter substrate-binding protein [Natrarchaeobaculum aegyptiacum]|uniref:Cobalamin-binding protein n=1 Tax=Natrarchaeobaculum aegyptiacum TaxID=745377 RepID=A0A2Z2HSV5_9EURY|nr:ABC transporter substrate-binding protein [Natrarchaeobaculum aegyptiacum]ARS89863.1 cobalamin-binding protein [Natrarchaeobaculum aegyptiacum]